MSAPVVSRRAFIATAATVTGGLVLGFSLPGRLASAPGYAVPFEPNAFLRIDPDGMVTVMVQRPEMGQGIRTTIAMLVAEELEADWSRVRIEQADLDPKYGTDAQYAGGSNSTPESWYPLRQAGATARAMLVSAAARRWGVAEGDCRATKGTVVHGASGRSARYGELADAASTIPVPTDVPLKPESGYRIVGRRTTHLDVPAIANGSIRFGLDVRVPGMLYASIERSPVFGGRVQHVDDSAARRVRGV